MKSQKRRQTRAAICFILPAALVFILFTVVPIIYALVISAKKYNIAMPAKLRVFVGLDNYIKVFKNTDFNHAMGWTFEFVVFAVVGTVVFATILAVLLNSNRLNKTVGNIIKPMFMLPMMLCPLIVANVWYIIFAPSYGLINSLLTQFGHTPISFFGNKHWAKFAIIVVEWWWATPYCMIIILAGLTTVPNELIESAKLDGASRSQIFFKVTLPNISGFIILVISIRLMDSIRMFDLSFALTEGAPDKATQTISYYIYQTGFKNMQLGEASAAAFVLLLIIAVITLLFVKKTNRLNYLDE